MRGGERTRVRYRVRLNRDGLAFDRGPSNIPEGFVGLGALVEDLFGPCEGGGGPDAKVTFAICGFRSGILQLVRMVDFVALSSNSKCFTFICVEEKISIGRGLEIRKIILHSGCISLHVYDLANLCVVSKRRDL
ncbi:Hypothetical predicted protein [Paramuricea clavata]|uniref:Uncharacterized protein n=1 Tax=Paramuricea clavata TaxID=317549 RepID=A0A6S7FQ34_PARCT|nr:Hypothetical predicted protein [Paramuricea clavata]